MDGKDEKTGQFLPGHTFCPPAERRRHASAVVKALAREKSKDAMQRLIDLALSGEPKIAIHAAREVLAYGIGKPEQVVQLNVDGDRSLKEMTEEELRARLDEILRSLAACGVDVGGIGTEGPIQTQ